LFYAYLRNNIFWMIILTVSLAFTWPIGYYQGLLLIAFPYQKVEFRPFTKIAKAGIYISSAAVFILSFIFIIIIHNADTHLVFVPKINRNLLPLSASLIVVLYIAFAKLFLNAKLFDIRYFYKMLDIYRIFFAMATFLIVTTFIMFLNLPPSDFYQTSSILENPTVHSLVRPMFTMVAHFTFFGTVICLLIFYWKRFANVVVHSGWGVVGAFALNLYMFGIMPESRILINLFPWITILLIVAINKINFSKAFYIVVAILSFISSRIWLIIDLKLNSSTDENGSIDFPSQLFYMNMGPWMSEKAYYYQLIFLVMCCLILFFVLFKVSFQGYKLKISHRPGDE
jgi:hypothetical protein